jgi:large-conductance mechanosensitive channel
MGARVLRLAFLFAPRETASNDPQEGVMVKDFREFILRGNLVELAVAVVIGSKFLYGEFINALLAFLIIAAVVFFLVVKPMNALMRRYKPETPVERNRAVV